MLHFAQERAQSRIKQGLNEGFMKKRKQSKQSEFTKYNNFRFHSVPDLFLAAPTGIRAALCVVQRHALSLVRVGIRCWVGPVGRDGRWVAQTGRGKALKVAAPARPSRARVGGLDLGA